MLKKFFVFILSSGAVWLAEKVAADVVGFTWDFFQIVQTYSPWDYASGIKTVLLLSILWIVAFLTSLLAKETASLVTIKNGS
jgi:hypothetical protein